MYMLYVTDTNGIISYFDSIFENAPMFDGAPVLSRKAKNIIEQAIISHYGEVKLSVPSIVFMEIHEKWLKEEEFARMFYFEVFTVLKEAPNVEIKPLDREVLENLISIDGILIDHDLHDKIVVASAMMLECPLITTDEKIIKYVDAERMIPRTIS